MQLLKDLLEVISAIVKALENFSSTNGSGSLWYFLDTDKSSSSTQSRMRIPILGIKETMEALGDLKEKLHTLHAGCVESAGAVREIIHTVGKPPHSHY
jgi:hypothetical protein